MTIEFRKPRSDKGKKRLNKGVRTAGKVAAVAGLGAAGIAGLRKVNSQQGRMAIRGAKQALGKGMGRATGAAGGAASAVAGGASAAKRAVGSQVSGARKTVGGRIQGAGRNLQSQGKRQMQAGKGMAAITSGRMADRAIGQVAGGARKRKLGGAVRKLGRKING